MDPDGVSQTQYSLHITNKWQFIHTFSKTLKFDYYFYFKYLDLKIENLYMIFLNFLYTYYNISYKSNLHLEDRDNI